MKTPRSIQGKHKATVPPRSTNTRASYQRCGVRCRPLREAGALEV